MPLMGASLVVLVVKNLSASAGDLKRCEFNPWVGKTPPGKGNGNPVDGIESP